ncbi:hypothetical protein GCM10009789_32230 [Kribbella sancticallisti]|uniref:Phosphoribosyltransferase domain-containing protein n=2 Tax=Kribbella sancticallisti TaxID=460087 RepID=A0ABN2DHM2_9ACTN
MLYADREDAGRRLAEELRGRVTSDAVILGLPRGGVPVAAEVAAQLGARLDVIIVRKLGLPSQPELGLGAVGENGVRVINQSLVDSTGISADELAAIEQRERAEVTLRARRFRVDRPAVALAGHPVVLVDDGIATGSTMLAACLVARAREAERVVVAVPVAARAGLSRVRAVADEVVCPHTPRLFVGVGQWYHDFRQTTDQEVIAVLAQ